MSDQYYVHVHDLVPGQLVDLEGDLWADPDGDRQELMTEYQEVAAVERETEYKVRVDFKSGLRAEFPVDHMVMAIPEDLFDEEGKG